jgi:hypothetical protein
VLLSSLCKFIVLTSDETDEEIWSTKYLCIPGLYMISNSDILLSINICLNSVKL